MIPERFFKKEWELSFNKSLSYSMIFQIEDFLNLLNLLFEKIIQSYKQNELTLPVEIRNFISLLIKYYSLKIKQTDIQTKYILYNKIINTLREKDKIYSYELSFQNFYVCEELNLCKKEIGILIRMSDKIQRINNILKYNLQAKESLLDSIEDLIAYALILNYFIQIGENYETEEKPSKGLSKKKIWRKSIQFKRNY